jgi:hypothetical protein
MAPVTRDGFAVVDDRAWPILMVRFPREVSADGMQAFANAIDRAYDRRERFVALVDAAPIAKLPSAPARKILTDWLTDPARCERDRACTIGTAVVLPSTPVRVLTAAINMVRPPVSPVRLTATLLEAAQWVRARLLDEGIALNAEASALYAELMTAPRRAAGGG